MAENIKKQLILVVDDMPDNIDVIGGVLGQDYEIKAALNGEKALNIAHAEPKPDMILLDVMMPGMDGYAVCRSLKKDPATSNIPVIFITAKDEVADEQFGFKLGAVDYMTKPVSPPILQTRVKTHLAFYDQNRILSEQVNKRTEELKHTRLKIIQRLGRAAEYRDNETGMHVIRVSNYARLIAQAYGGNDSWVERVFNAAPMHDVGKIGIPDHILLKPGKLDDEERTLMKKHTEFGAEIIGDDADPLLQMSCVIAMTHHEKFDGTGYPKGLAGKEIPLEGRIVAIADVFDALTSERVYKKAWSVEEAIKFIDGSAGKDFDADLVSLFHEVMPDILRIKEQYMDEAA